MCYSTAAAGGPAPDVHPAQLSALPPPPPLLAPAHIKAVTPPQLQPPLPQLQLACFLMSIVLSGLHGGDQRLVHSSAGPAHQQQVSTLHTGLFRPVYVVLCMSRCAAEYVNASLRMSLCYSSRPCVAVYVIIIVGGVHN
jgi:hypothetical protein